MPPQHLKKWLLRAGPILVALAIIALPVAAWLIFQHRALQSRLSRLGLAQGVLILWNQDSPQINREGFEQLSGSRVGWLRLNEYGGIFAEELSLYPEKVLGKLGVKKFVLAENLRSARHSIGGITQQKRGTIVLNAYASGRALFLKQQAIHHEIFHALDRWGYFEDKEWARRSSYIGNSEMENWSSPSELPGFINNYSRTFPGEDKAEVFSHLIAINKYVGSIAGVDPILAAKVRLMKKRLAGLKLGFDDAFWERMAARPFAAGEWTAQAEAERLRLEPPHPLAEPLHRPGEPRSWDPKAQRRREIEEQKKLQPPQAPL